MPVLVGTHIISYVISHSFYRKIFKIYYGFTTRNKVEAVMKCA